MVLLKFSANQVGKRLKWNKFGPIYERCFVFTVLVKFSGSQKISGKKFGNYGNDLYAIFVFVQFFGGLFIVRISKALGLEEKSSTSSPHQRDS